MPLASRWSLLILWPCGQRSRSYSWSLKKCLLTPLLEHRQTWYSGCPLSVFPTEIQITWPKLKVKLLSAAYLIFYDSSCESRSNYQLQTIEMQHLRISSLILPSNQFDYNLLWSVDRWYQVAETICYLMQYLASIDFVWRLNAFCQTWEQYSLPYANRLKAAVWLLSRAKCICPRNQFIEDVLYIIFLLKQLSCVFHLIQTRQIFTMIKWMSACI